MNKNIWKNYIYNYVSDNNIVDFYNKFLETFENEWNTYISEYEFNDLCQLSNGNRLRPMLVYWGYLLNKENERLFDISSEELNYIVKPCIVIESIHKMSLLVDDWIDGDIARHGAPTFHTLYGSDTAVLLAMNLLLKAYLELSHYLSNSNLDTYCKTLPMALQIAYDMTKGALNEISSKDVTLDIAKVKEIVSLETSSIIRHAVIIGYSVRGYNNEEILDLLDDIGYCCGYIFQALNDLEPFGNVNDLMKHKGGLTTDVLKSRKNIVIAYIYAWAEENEIDKLSSYQDPSSMSEYVIQLINKYQIKKHIMTEISNLQSRIKDRISKIEKKTSCFNWCKHFNNFIEITINASKKRASI
ncbi:MAG: polyprenyl synthetase family protein [Clostridium sp.]|nr:polyprenyl synthetase family protein [Clostridium sp.]